MFEVLWVYLNGSMVWLADGLKYLDVNAKGVWDDSIDVVTFSFFKLWLVTCWYWFWLYVWLVLILVCWVIDEDGCAIRLVLIY